MTPEAISVGDVVQIVDETHPWYPCLLVVSEIKSWGVQAAVLIPNSNDGSEKVGEAYNRLPFEKVVRTGKAEVWHE